MQHALMLALMLVISAHGGRVGFATDKCEGRATNGNTPSQLTVLEYSDPCETNLTFYFCDMGVSGGQVLIEWKDNGLQVAEVLALRIDGKMLYLLSESELLAAPWRQSLPDVTNGGRRANVTASVFTLVEARPVREVSKYLGFKVIGLDGTTVKYQVLPAGPAGIHTNRVVAVFKNNLGANRCMFAVEDLDNDGTFETFSSPSEKTMPLPGRVVNYEGDGTWLAREISGCSGVLKVLSGGQLITRVYDNVTNMFECYRCPSANGVQFR
jgi:hypothetical protein